MPVLQNKKWEKFAQEVAKGKSAGDALAASGIERRACAGDTLGFYIYALIDPRDDTVFYVGKGKGQRYASHVQDWKLGRVKNPAKFKRIGEIYASGLTVESIYLASGLTEDAAYALESLIIRMAGFEKLTNILPGISTTSQQRALEAKGYLSQIMPFCTWQAGKSAQHIEWYWGIIGELKQIAAGKTIKGIQVACPN